MSLTHFCAARQPRSDVSDQAHEDAMGNVAGNHQHGVAIQAAIEAGVGAVGRERAQQEQA